MKTISRILYKYYLVGIFFSFWSGLVLLDVFYWLHDDKVWGLFLVICSLLLALSEYDFITKCNEIFSGKTETVRIGDTSITTTYNGKTEQEQS